MALMRSTIWCHWFRRSLFICHCSVLKFWL